MLARYPNWFCDGTFDSAPLGYQLYTVHALLTETVTIPLIFCIAKNKTEVTYNQIFSTLKERDPSLQPDTIMIDFERAFWASDLATDSDPRISTSLPM